MKRIIITLVCTVAVFVGTLLLTNMYINKMTEEVAEEENNMMLDSFCNDLEWDLKMTLKSTRNFLGFVFYSVSDDEYEPMVLDYKYLNHFKKYIFEYLEGFMRINKNYISATVVVDSAACSTYYGMDRAWAPMMYQGDTIQYDLTDYYDFAKSEHFATLKKDRRTFWAIPLKTSRVAEKLVSIYVPLVMEDGKYFGTCVVSRDIESIDSNLKYHLPYDEEGSQMMLIDENGTVFASYPQKPLDGELIYERKTEYAPWTIKTICTKEAVYGYAYRISLIALFISLIGILLVSVCCVVVFRQISQNMRKKAIAEEELKVAANLQMSILKPADFSSSHVHIETFLHPAIQAGGDLYDYVEVGGKTLAIIGDVSGKGMPAALFMTQVVSLFRNATRYTQNPTEIMGQINDSLAENNPTMTFCTAIIACVDGQQLTLCNAGHTRPILVHGATRETEFVTLRPNLPLGLIQGYQFALDEITYDHDDTFIMYTDGVTEAQDRDNRLYGEERLMESVTKGHYVADVVASIKQFCQATAQSDDITIVAMVNQTSL